MQEYFLIIVIVWLFVMLALAIIKSNYAVKKDGELLQKQAQKRQGIFRWVFYSKALFIQEAGVNIKMFFARGKSGTSTVFQCRFGRAPFLTKLVSIKLFSPEDDSMIPGRESLNKETSVFQKSFIVSGEEANKLLPDDIQLRLIRLKDKVPAFVLQGRKLHFSIASIPEDEQAFDDFIEAGLALVRKIQELN